MGTKFVGQYSGKEHRRDHLMFLAAAGLAFSLLVIVFLLNQRPVEANNPVPVEETAAASVGAGTVTLFVPTRSVAAGTKLNESLFRDVYWPRSQVPEEAVRDLSEIRGKFAKYDMKQDQPLRRSDLSDERRIVSLPITPGMRAVTIEVGATDGVEGWALPGSRVDVVLTYMQDGSLTSKVIVQNARVLSQAGSLETPEEMAVKSTQRNLKAHSTITLEVTPADALTIATSKALGSITLFMRAGEDDKATAITEVNKHQIDGNTARPNRNAGRQCNKGVMRLDGRQYMIDCDGGITQMPEGNEP